MTKKELLEKIVLQVDYYRHAQIDAQVLTELLMQMYKDIQSLENVK